MLHFPQWKLIVVFGVVLAGLIFALPNVFPRATMETMPGWLPHKQVSLGLDLQGGAHLLYQLDENEMIEDWLNKLRDDVRETLRKDRVPYTDLTQNLATRTVSVKIREAADFEKAYEDLRKLSVPVSNTFGLTGAHTLDVSRSGDNGVTLKATDAGLTQRMNSAIQASIETIRRRVDAFGTTEPSIQRQGRNRVLVQVPGISDVERLKRLIGETGKLEFRMVDAGANVQQVVESKQVPVDDELLYSKDDPPQPYVIKKQVLVSGENLVDAQPGFDQRTNEPIVTFRFDATGAKRFARATQENVGLPFAIILDGKVVSAPVIREPILGGSGQISGNFTVAEASDLAVTLRSGALPAKLTVIEERTVGASLGADSIAQGKQATLLGLLLVVIFMFVAYGLFGVFANIALLVNIAHHLRRAVVDRLDPDPSWHRRHRAHHRYRGRRQRAHQRAHPRGGTLRQVAGCRHRGRIQRAMTTIIDSNMTTLISTLVLFWLGSGAVRGFAVTLTIGILASMFTAVTVTRLMVSYWLRWARPAALPI